MGDGEGEAHEKGLQDQYLLDGFWPEGLDIMSISAAQKRSMLRRQ